MPVTIHPSIVDSGRVPILADSDFHKGIGSGVVGVPADLVNILADLNKAQAQAEQGEKWLPSFLAAQEENPYTKRFGTSQYIQELLGGDPESSESFAGYLVGGGLSPIAAYKAAAPLLTKGLASFFKSTPKGNIVPFPKKEGIEKLEEQFGKAGVKYIQAKQPQWFEKVRKKFPKEKQGIETLKDDVWEQFQIHLRSPSIEQRAKLESALDRLSAKRALDRLSAKRKQGIETLEMDFSIFDRKPSWFEKGGKYSDPKFVGPYEDYITEAGWFPVPGLNVPKNYLTKQKSELAVKKLAAPIRKKATYTPPKRMTMAETDAWLAKLRKDKAAPLLPKKE